MFHCSRWIKQKWPTWAASTMASSLLGRRAAMETRSELLTSHASRVRGHRQVPAGATSLILPLLIACNPFDPVFQNGVRCTPDDKCPEGQICAEDGRCYHPDDVPPPGDAGSDASDSLELPILNDQPADLVLGQLDLFSNEHPAEGARSSSSLCDADVGFPSNGMIHSNDTRFWVADTNRVLQWDTVPTTNFEPADLIYGQALGSDEDDQPTDARSLGGPSGIWVDGARLYISDRGRNRVLIWDPLESAFNFQPANRVLGQANFESQVGAGGRGILDRFLANSGVWTDGTRLIVTGPFPLVWNTPPTENLEPADYQMASEEVGITDANGPGQGTSQPYFDGMRLYIPDSGANRILVWNGFPETPRPADFVIGQRTFGESEENNGSATPRADTLCGPRSVTTFGNALFVADTCNFRVLVFSPIPTESQPSAVAVLGQPNFTSRERRGPGPTGFGKSDSFVPDEIGPTALTVADGALWVFDPDNCRVLRFRFQN